MNKHMSVRRNHQAKRAGAAAARACSGKDKALVVLAGALPRWLFGARVCAADRHDTAARRRLTHVQ